MNYRDIRTLKILEKIDKDDLPSQRALANELSISLGLVNSFIKQLANKGYFKITTIPKNRVRYIITPKGIAEKTRLTYEYIKHAYQFYSEARQSIGDLYRQLEINGCSRIVLYGANNLAEIAYVSCNGTSLSIAAIVDDHKAGGRLFDNEIQERSVLNCLDFDKILITALNDTQKIFSRILSEGISEKKIIDLCHSVQWRKAI